MCWLINWARVVGGQQLPVKGRLASLAAPGGAALDRHLLAAFENDMSQHTPPSRHPKSNRRCLPRGRAKLVALEEAVQLAGDVYELAMPRGFSHLRDHLVRAADNTALRLSEASGRTLGNRYQHLEAAYAENQEVQSDLILVRARGTQIPPTVVRDADRLGGLIYGLLRAEARSRDN